jgi:CheY-like chemotaxis protein
MPRRKNPDRPVGPDPNGVSALLPKRGAPLAPRTWGGHQQQGRRPGTEPVVLAVGLAAALAAARADPPEMVVLDLGMPGMDGFEAARRLRALPGTKGTLLVAVTGWAQEDDRRRCHEAGFDGHLPKPVERDAVRRFLAHPKLLRHRPAAS